MANGYFTLAGVAIKSPTSFKIERYNLTEANRLANGKMTMELIAKKRKFYLQWAAIDAKDLDVILNVIWESSTLFWNFTYYENDIKKSAIVYAGGLASDLHSTRPNGWVWKDISFNFIEQ